MPVGSYYGGNGREVMSRMVAEYGAKKGRAVFYATANKKGAAPVQPRKKARRKKRHYS